MDRCGILNIVDRKKDIFKYHLHVVSSSLTKTCNKLVKLSYQQINPTEIENIIQSLDGIEQVSVVGIPNDGTNLTCAVVVKRKGYDHLTKSSIVNYVAQRLPEYKQLHGGVVFVGKIPTTPTGKVIKRLIAKLAEEEFRKN